MTEPYRESAGIVPVAPSVVRSLDTLPDLLALHAADPGRYFCLLQSSGTAPRTGRYDILFAEPTLLDCAPAHDALRVAALMRRINAVAAPIPPPQADDGDALPFTGGVVFHLSYEASGAFEPRLQLPAAAVPTLGDVIAWSVPAAIIIDRVARKAWCVADSETLCDKIHRDARLGRAPAVQPHHAGVRALRQDPPERFMQGVTSVLEYLRSGDAFQVNLSRGWEADLPAQVSPASLHAAMAQHNPAPFSALLQHGETTLLSASPERLVQAHGGVVETRPIAGTRRRGASAEEDRMLCEDLRASGKECAEHIMLIDLERNDLGRVCEAGSIVVDELLTLEHYASVHHLVSNVRGRIASGVQWSDLLRAVFPGGTITGCPKFRVMQIIADLEQTGRGCYTGTLGYVSNNGRMDSSILIRTMCIHEGTAWFRAGAGIVADSDPLAELAETESKARGLLQGLGA